MIESEAGKIVATEIETEIGIGIGIDIVPALTNTATGTEKGTGTENTGMTTSQKPHLPHQWVM